MRKLYKNFRIGRMTVEAMIECSCWEAACRCQTTAVMAQTAAMNAYVSSAPQSYCGNNPTVSK